MRPARLIAYIISITGFILIALGLITHLPQPIENILSFIYGMLCFAAIPGLLYFTRNSKVARFVTWVAFGLSMLVVLYFAIVLFALLTFKW